MRRYTPGTRPWHPFHQDRAYATVNVALSDDAWEIFEIADKGNGFEAWRQVLFDVVKKTRVEKIRLERLVLNPPQCRNND